MPEPDSSVTPNWSKISNCSAMYLDSPMTGEVEPRIAMVCGEVVIGSGEAAHAFCFHCVAGWLFGLVICKYLDRLRDYIKQAAGCLSSQAKICHSNHLPSCAFFLYDALKKKQQHLPFFLVGEIYPLAEASSRLRQYLTWALHGMALSQD